MKQGLILMGLVAVAAAQGATFLVDAQAAAGGDGSAAKPWRSVAEAVAGVRAARANGTVKAGEGVVVEFAAGDYVVAEGVKLTAADSGTAAAPVVWRSRGTERARLTGGVRVPAERFRKVDDPAVLARLPEAARGKVYVADLAGTVPGAIPAMANAFGGTPSAPLLFTGGRHGTLARWPNADYTSFTKAVDRGGLVRRRPDGGTVRSPGAFIYGNPRAKRWNFAEGVWMNGYWTHDWDNHSVRAASYGAENGTNDVIRLAANIPYGVMGGTWGRKDRRFYVFNLLDELDAPGEWWLDRARKLLYLYPRNGAPTAADETTLAFSAAPILKIEQGRHLRFERLVFEYGYGSGIAAAGADLAFIDCKVANVGRTGASVWGDRNVVRGCEVCNIGQDGISVGGGDRKTLRKAETLVEGCHVHDWALYRRTYAPGIGVNGCGVTLRRNRMHDAPHSAVLYGGNEHLFEYNEVYRVLMETGDAGAYYTGRDWTTMGNVLRYNNTHDLGAEGEHANTMGFYFDDCDCGDAVYGNIFHNVARGIMVGGGREHPIRNNIFSKCLIGLSIDCRGMTWKQWNSKEHGDVSWQLEDKAKRLDYTNGVWAAKYPLLAKIMQDHPREPLYDPVENNVFIDCRKELLALDGKASECLERMAPIRGNLVINTVGTNGVRTAKPDRRIAAGFRVVNGMAEKPFDAGFVDAAHGNFALRSDAWLLKEMPNFKPLPPACDPAASVECRVRDGLPNVRAKLAAGEEVRIAYLGGSITEANPGWRAMTLDWFRTRYPRAKIVEINASISGTGSDYGACRLPRDVLGGRPDLLFVEFRVNGSAGYDYPSVEGIIRQTWAANPKTDICFVYTLGAWMMPELAAGRQTGFGAAMETLCNFYGIPSIDFGPEIARRVAAGALVFRPTAETAGKEPPAFTRDGCHPVKEGHEIYRDVVARSLAERILPASGPAGAHALPAPFSKSAWVAAELVPSASLLKGEIWKPIDLEKDPVYRETYGRTHRMLCGGVWTDREGTSVTLRWTGNTIGFSDIPQSRENPMLLEVSIDGGKPYTVTRGRTTEPRIYSRFWYLPEQAWGEHTVTVTLRKLPAGQRWLVGQFLVVGNGLALNQ